MTQTILIIDDEPELIKLLDYNLTKAGYLAVSLARRMVPGTKIFGAAARDAATPCRA